MSAARFVTGLLCLLGGCHGLRDTSPSETSPAPIASTAPSPATERTPPSVAPVRTSGGSSTTDQAGVRTAAYSEPADSPSATEPILAPTPTETGRPRLTLDQLEELALSNNPAVAQLAGRVRALRGRWVQAGLPPNPTIGYQGEEIGAMGTAGLQGGFVGQRFITGGKLGLDRAIVSEQIQQAEQQLFSLQQRVLTDVRLAYYDVLIAQRRIELAQELLRISQQAVETSQRLLKQGEIPRVGLLQTEVEARNTQILLQRAQNEAAAAWTRLTSVVGIPDMQRMRLEGDLETLPTLEFQRQLERILEQSPEIAAAVAAVRQARWAVDRAYAEVIPDVTAQAAVLRDNESGETVAGVQVGMPLPLWNKNQGGIQEARQQVFAAQRNVARAELNLRARLAVAFRQYADARYQVQMYSDRILPTAKETLDLVSTGYDAGEVGYLDLLAAQRTYFQTTLSYIDALQELWQATLRIDGLLLEDSLQATPQVSRPGPIRR